MRGRFAAPGLLTGRLYLITPNMTVEGFEPVMGWQDEKPLRTTDRRRTPLASMHVGEPGGLSLHRFNVLEFDL
jgi:hypothetical protein